jgi:hypothetical protein
MFQALLLAQFDALQSIGAAKVAHLWTILPQVLENPTSTARVDLRSCVATNKVHTISKSHIQCV